MNNKEIVERLEKVFSFFVCNKQAKIWNLGTNIYNTWVLLNKFLSSNNLKNVATIKIIEVENKKNKTYKLSPTKHGIITADKINITPATGRAHNGWSEAGIRQFLQEGSAMNIIMYNKNDRVFNEFKVTAEFNNVCSNIDKLWWLNKIKNLILHSLTSKQPHIINLGFTLFYVLIGKLYPTLFDNFKNNFKLSYKVGRSKIKKQWDTKAIKTVEKLTECTKKKTHIKV